MDRIATPTSKSDTEIPKLGKHQINKTEALRSSSKHHFSGDESCSWMVGVKIYSNERLAIKKYL